MLTEQDFKRIYWHSRRGMLELDLILIPFVEQRLRQVQPEVQSLYQELLREEDQDLFGWFIHRDEAPLRFKPLVERILAGHGPDSRPA